MKKIYTLTFFIFFTCFYNAQVQVPPCTVNLLPVAGAVNLDPYPSIILKWAPVAGATSYDVYMSGKVPTKQYIATVLSETYNFITVDYGLTYYWYIVPKNEFGEPIGCESLATTSFTTIPPPPPPSNDECSNSINISSMATNGSTLGASESMPAIFCNGYTGSANDDVWYDFTAIENGTIIISLAGNNNFDGVLQIFSGVCGSLTSLACSDTSQNGGKEEITIAVIAGNNYKIRVYNFNSLLGGRGTFSISATSAPLPVSLINFKAEPFKNKNVITWETLSEQNNLGFELQYSDDGNNFTKLAFINSKAINGSSEVLLSYDYTDSRLLYGNIYYRLKQTDKDGRYAYSKIAFIKGEKSNAIVISNIYPNPAKNKLNLTVVSPIGEKINLLVTDLAGKVVLRQATTVISGNNNLVADIATLSSGTYFIKAVGNSGSKTSVSKFVKE